ncbi:hypothetical protein Hanom_Chr16g01504851 [Helianthus anomalus]
MCLEAAVRKRAPHGIMCVFYVLDLLCKFIFMCVFLCFRLSVSIILFFYKIYNFNIFFYFFNSASARLELKPHEAKGKRLPFF